MHILAYVDTNFYHIYFNTQLFALDSQSLEIIAAFTTFETITNWRNIPKSICHVRSQSIKIKWTLSCLRRPTGTLKSSLFGQLLISIWPKYLINDSRWAQRFSVWFKRQPQTWAGVLSVLLTVGSDQMEHFLLHLKMGFCQHLLRNIPQHEEQQQQHHHQQLLFVRRENETSMLSVLFCFVYCFSLVALNFKQYNILVNRHFLHYSDQCVSWIVHEYLRRWESCWNTFQC